MSFFRSLGATARAFQGSRNVGKAYAIVAHEFHLTVSHESIRESSHYLAHFAQTLSAHDMALEYLSHYGRKVGGRLVDHPGEAAEAQRQFQGFVRKLAEMRRSGVRFQPMFLNSFRATAEHLGADVSSI
jgi:hypothetical protein